MRGYASAVARKKSGTWGVRWRSSSGGRIGAMKARAREQSNNGYGAGYATRLYGSPTVIEKETGKKLNHARFLLTGCSGGSDRTLPPSVRSILERSKSPEIMTERVW